MIQDGLIREKNLKILGKSSIKKRMKVEPLSFTEERAEGSNLAGCGTLFLKALGDCLEFFRLQNINLFALLNFKQPFLGKG